MKAQVTYVAAVGMIVAVAVLLSIGHIVTASIKEGSGANMCTTGTWNATVGTDQPAVAGNDCLAIDYAGNKCCLTYNATSGCCATYGTTSSAYNTLGQTGTALTLGDIIPLVMVAALIIGVLVSAFSA